MTNPDDYPRHLEYIAVNVLVTRGNPRNVKGHDEAAIAASVGLFGYTTPIELDDRTGLLVAGHGRVDNLAAAETRGDDPPDGIVVGPEGHWYAPVIRGWQSRDDDHAEAYMIANNQVGPAGGWTPDLGPTLAHLATTNWGIPPGFTQDDIDRLLADLQGDDKPTPNTDPDDIPPSPPPITQPGDLWLLGPHRIICGDATDRATHDSLIGSDHVDLVLTDPPYGVNIDYGVGIDVTETFDDTPGYVASLAANLMPLIRRWPVILMTTGIPCLALYPPPDWLLAWIVPAGHGSGPWGFTTWNPVAAYGKDPYLARGLGRRPDSVTMMALRDPDVIGHPVIKPVEVWKWLMQRGSPAEGEIVLDPFCGSGTTIIAAHHLARRALGIELQPAYVDIACRRYQEHTGTMPRYAATNEPVDFSRSN